MKTIIYFTILCLFCTEPHSSLATSVNNFNIVPGNRFVVQQNDSKEQTYCSPYAKTKYKVLITGSKIRITRLYKEYKNVFTGIYKKGRIFSNDPNEKKSRSANGRYYKLQDHSFGVLNIENGDYDWFELCSE
jgi:hypothetical protein